MRILRRTVGCGRAPIFAAGEPNRFEIVGITEPERVEQTLRFAESPIPDKLWEELEPLAAVGRSGLL